MRKLYRNLTVLLVLLFTFSNTLISQTSFGIKVGLASPNDNFTGLLTTVRDSSGAAVEQQIMNKASNGYHVSANFYFSLKYFDAYGSFGINRFSESKVNVPDPKDQTKSLAEIEVTRNVIPLEVGIKKDLYSLSLLTFYGQVGVSNCILTQSTDVKYFNSTSVALPVQTSESSYRLGASVGAGILVDLKLVKGMFEFKYVTANPFSTDENEKLQSYYNLTLGVLF